MAVAVGDPQKKRSPLTLDGQLDDGKKGVLRQTGVKGRKENILRQNPLGRKGGRGTVGKWKEEQ